MTHPKFLRLLIADDSSAMRSLIKAVLQSHFSVGRVFEAGDAERALAIFKANEIDLIVTDIAMEPGDGLMLIEAVRSFADPERRKVPIIAVTGYSTKTLVERLRDLGVHEVLTKPVSTRSLRDHVQAVFDSPRDFVEGEEYFGPDRRRLKNVGYAGPDRRDAMVLSEVADKAAGEGDA